jgi:hypothetical protein
LIDLLCNNNNNCYSMWISFQLNTVLMQVIIFDEIFIRFFVFNQTMLFVFIAKSSISRFKVVLMRLWNWGKLKPKRSHWPVNVYQTSKNSYKCRGGSSWFWTVASARSSCFWGDSRWLSKIGPKRVVKHFCSVMQHFCPSGSYW